MTELAKPKKTEQSEAVTRARMQLEDTFGILLPLDRKALKGRALAKAIDELIRARLEEFRL